MNRTRSTPHSSRAPSFSAAVPSQMSKSSYSISKPLSSSTSITQRLSTTSTRSLSSLSHKPSTQRSIIPSHRKHPNMTAQRSFHSSRKTMADAQTDGKPAAVAAIDDIPPQVTKIVDDIKQLNIMHTLQLVKLLKTEFGYNDAAFAMAAPAAAPAAAAPAEEEAKPVAPTKSVFNLKLESFDAASKVKVIKEVRTISGLGLKEAKELVEGAPQILKKEIKKEEGEKLIALLKECGAVCVLE